MFSPATFHRIPAIFLLLPSLAASRNHDVLFCYFLTLLSRLSFDSAFCSTTQHLAYSLALVFVCIPATISFHRSFSQSTPLHGTSNELFQ